MPNVSTEMFVISPCQQILEGKRDHCKRQCNGRFPPSPTPLVPNDVKRDQQQKVNRTNSCQGEDRRSDSRLGNFYKLSVSYQDSDNS